jgi:cytochrome c
LRTIHLAAAAAAVLALAAATPALANESLARQKQCLQCHAVDAAKIGPSFRQIGATYRGVKRPQAMLIAVMREGSSANLGPHWGQVRMPDGSERPRISDAEARQLARWILKL